MTGNSTRRDLAMLLAGSSTAVLSPPAGRQLRSRLVPIATDRAPVFVNARPVRGKRRSRSTTSLRSSEADTCSNVNSPVRPSRAMTSIVCTNTSAVVTRSTARMHTGSARMTFGTGLIRSGAMKHRGEARSLQRSPGVLLTQNQKNTKVSPAKISKTRAAQHELERVQVDLEICCEVAGCKVRLLPLAMEEHQIECSSHFPCPLNINCKWVGPISQTVNHIVKEHHRAVACKTGPNDIILLKGWRRPETMQWITIQTCLGQDFLVMIKKCDKNRSPIFCGTVSIFGEQENADRFDYRMKLRSHDGAHRAFSYSSVVCPHHNANSVLSDSDCFRFDYSYAEKFSHEDKLEVEVSISVMKM